MLGQEDPQVLVTSFETIQFQRSTLSAKVIKLRKESQDNHVRRMKIAQQRKGFLSPQNSSLCLSISTRKSSIFKSPFTFAAGVPTNVNNEQYNRMGTGESVRKNISYDNATPQTKYSEVGNDNYQALFIKCRTQNINYRLPSDSTKCKSHHMVLSKQFSPDKKSGVRHVAKPSVTMKREKGVLSKSENMHTVSDSEKGCVKTGKNANKSENPMNDLETKINPEILILNKEKGRNKLSKPLIEDNLGSHLLPQKKCSNRSRIPVLSARLASEDENERKFKILIKNPDNSRKSDKKIARNLLSNEMSKSMLKERNLDMEENISGNAPVEQMKKLTIQNNYKMPSIRTNNFSLDSFNDYSGKLRSNRDHNNANATDMSPSKLSNISKWLNSIIDTSDRKNSSGSQIISCENKSTSSQDVSSRPTLGSEKTLKPENTNKESGISNKPSSTNSNSGDSSESYYDTEEAEEILIDNNKTCESTEWEEDYDVGSTITLPSDKELDLAHHRENVFRNLPDYPNTPYNLRYPRYKIWEKNNYIRSVDIETEGDSNRRKILKNPKKSFHTTPKRRKSSKIQRNIKSKKMISRKKENV